MEDGGKDAWSANMRWRCRLEKEGENCEAGSMSWFRDVPGLLLYVAKVPYR